MDVPIGDAVITTGGNLKARHVIHAVESKPPIRQTGNEEWAQFREEWLKDIEPLQLSAIGPSLLATPALAFKWSQLSDSVFLDRVNSGKIPLFYGLVKHSSRTPPNSSCTPNLLAILLAIGRC